MAFVLAVGFDRADGVTLLPVQPTGTGGTGQTLGTATPTDFIFILNNNDQSQITQELTDSPEIERAEQATFQHTFRTSWANCLALIPMLARGVFVTDSSGNIWRILSAKIQHDRGTWGKLTLVAESISFDSPPDEYQIVDVELGIDIIKHPRYFWALNPTPNNPIDGSNDYTTNVGIAPNTATIAQVKSAIIRAIQNYRDSPQQPSANLINGLLQNQVINQFNISMIPIGVPGTQVNVIANTICQFAIAAAGEIIQKLWRNLDTPYLPGWQITWSQYFFAPMYLNPGAYEENPVGIVPDYFISPSQDGSNTIFDQMAQINPQDFSNNGHTNGGVSISWLRKSDRQIFQRTWFRIERNWIGAPVGNWDTELFTPNARPDFTPYDQTGVRGFLPLPNG